MDKNEFFRELYEAAESEIALDANRITSEHPTHESGTPWRCRDCRSGGEQLTGRWAVSDPEIPRRH